jgi:hypothetical protein
MTAAMLGVYALQLSSVPDPMPLAITTGIIAQVANAELITVWIVLLGIVVQFTYGAVWGGLLAVSSQHVTVGKAIIVAIGLWLMMIVFYVPMAGYAVFDMATNGAMWGLSFVFHLIYGATVGYLLQRDQARERYAGEEEVLATR